MTLLHYPDRTVALSDEARECPRCRTMTFVYVNRTGRTVCLYCDDGEYNEIAV